MKAYANQEKHRLAIVQPWRGRQSTVIKIQWQIMIAQQSAIKHFAHRLTISSMVVVTHATGLEMKAYANQEKHRLAIVQPRRGRQSIVIKIQWQTMIAQQSAIKHFAHRLTISSMVVVTHATGLEMKAYAKQEKHRLAIVHPE